MSIVDHPGVEPSLRPPDRVEALAAEFVAKQLAGEEPSPAAYAARCLGAAERARFLELVEDAAAVDALLPRQAREGRLLAGRYRLLSEVGSGGMGKVFAAFDEQLGRKVAVKVLATPDLGALDPVGLFQREAEMLARFDHPGIVAVHEVGADGDVRFFVMDLVAGTSLARVVERLRERASGSRSTPGRGAELAAVLDAEPAAGAQSLYGDEPWPQTVARIGAELARIVEFAHDNGVIHRDLKPANVMLRGDGSPVVLDFGLAAVMEQQTGDLTRRLFGSACYLAPEQAEAKAAGKDPQSDVYQVGLVLYELLTLRRAFGASEISAVLAAIEAGRFTAPRQFDRAIPAELEAVVLRAMERNPARRYRSARELRQDLERVLSGTERPLAARGGAPAFYLRDARYFARRHRTAVVVAAALLLASALAALWIDRGRDGHPLDYFAASANGERVRELEPLAAVRRGERLGLALRGGEPRHVYACLVYGPESGPSSFVQPCRLSGPDGRSFGLRVQGSGARELCAEVPAGDPSLAYVGLFVFVEEEANAILEGWLASMADAIDRLGTDALPRSIALEHLEAQLSSSRGGAAAGSDAAQWKAMRARFQAAAADARTDPLAELGAERIRFRVQ